MKRIRVTDLTLREKIGQTACLRATAIKMTESADVFDYFRKNPFGSMWTSGFAKMDFVNMAGEWKDHNEIDYDVDKNVRAFINSVNDVVKVPVLSAADAEYGVRRIFPYLSDTPTGPAIAATKDPEIAFRLGQHIGKEMRLAKTRWAWCDVADNASPFNAVMATRCFSSDVELSCGMVAEYAKGFQSAGVAATLKHFPGADRDEYRDSHFSDQAIGQTMEEWWERQGRIFEAGIRAGAYSVMLSHCSFPAADSEKINGKNTPAPMSYKIVTELLKGKMGFDGVVITDAVAMRAVTGIYPTRKEMYVKMYNAGVDVILGPTEHDYIDMIENAVLEGLIPESRIDDACERVLAMKEKLGLFDESEEEKKPVDDRVRADVVRQTQEYVREIAPRAITWVCRDKNMHLIPLSAPKIKNVQIFYLGYSEAAYRDLAVVKEEFEKRGASVTLSDRLDNGRVLYDAAQNNDLILYFLHLAGHSPFGGLSFYGEKALSFLNVLLYGREKSVGISIGSQFIYHAWMPSADNFINTYCSQPEMLRALVAGLYGECEFTGGFPYDPNPLAKRL